MLVWITFVLFGCSCWFKKGIIDITEARNSIKAKHETEFKLICMHFHWCAWCDACPNDVYPSKREMSVDVGWRLQSNHIQYLIDSKSFQILRQFSNSLWRCIRCIRIANVSPFSQPNHDQQCAHFHCYQIYWRRLRWAHRDLGHKLSKR